MELGRIGIRSVRGPFDSRTVHDQLAPPGWCRIDPGLGAAATRLPAASREDSHPQAILKFHRLSRLDYRASNELPVKVLWITVLYLGIAYQLMLGCKDALTPYGWLVYLFVLFHFFKVSKETNKSLRSIRTLTNRKEVYVIWGKLELRCWKWSLM